MKKGLPQLAGQSLCVGLHAVLGDDLLLGLAQDVVLLADLGERGERLVEVMDLVAGRDLGADAGLALRHDREEEADGVDALVVQVAETSWDSLALKSMTGTIGVSPSLRTNPASVRPLRQ